jgi:hypothetical protein
LPALLLDLLNSLLSLLLFFGADDPGGVVEEALDAAQMAFVFSCCRSGFLFGVELFLPVAVTDAPD